MTTERIDTIANEIIRLRVALAELEAELEAELTVLADHAKVSDAGEDAETIAGLRAILAEAREVLEFAASFQITNGNNREVAEDSLHEIRKAARAFLERLRADFASSTPPTRRP